jgi:hypothetical protein
MLDSSVRKVAARLFALARMTRYPRTQKTREALRVFG